MNYYFALHKSPKPDRGRIGPERIQDWYQGIVLASVKARQDPQGLFLIITDCHVQNADHEADIYQRVLRDIDFPKEKILEIREGYETIEQIERAFDLIRKGDRLILVVAPSHYLRVVWLCIVEKWLRHYSYYTVHIGWGLPRTKEFFTDMLLTVFFPLIDLVDILSLRTLRLRNRFKKAAVNRRKVLRRQ